MKKITALNILENYRVGLRFNDGVEGEVDFSSKPRTGVFAFWNNYDNFRLARIGDSGELVWNDQLDFCPDSLWLQVTGREPEALLDQKAEPVHAWTADCPNPQRVESRDALFQLATL
jgi:hypothetical protein